MTGASRDGSGLSPLVIVAVAASAVTASVGFSRFTYGVLLPAMTEDVIGSYSRAGTLGTLNFAGYLGGIVVVSLVSTRVGPIRLTWMGLWLTTIALAAIGLAPSFALLVPAMIVAGVGAAGVWVPMTAVVGSVVSDARRGFAMGAVVAGPGVGIVLAGQFAAWTGSVGGLPGWRIVWLLEALIATVVTAVAVMVLRRIPDLSTDEPGFAWSFLMRLPGWVRLTVAYGAYGFGYIIYMTFLVAALEEDAGLPSSVASAMFSVVGIASIFGGMAVGRLSDYTGRRRALVLAYVLQVVAIGLLLTHERVWVVVSVLVFGLMLTGVGAVVTAHIGDRLHGGAVSAAFGSMTVVFGFCQMLGPQVGGWLAERTGSFTVSFVVAAAALTVGALAAWSLPRTAERVGR